jgi:hypothetical protein
VIEMGREYRTRCGFAVRLYTTESRSISGPVIGEYEMLPNEWVLCIWGADGKYATDSRHLDLIEVKPVRVFERWVNVYESFTELHPTKLQAERAYASGRIACLHIRQEYREGDGLSS